MKLPENKKKVQEAMDRFMQADRAKHAVLGISKFGLMQITRQRMRPEVNINTSEICPSCAGTGKVSATLLLEDEIEKRLHYLFTHQHSNLTLMVHPILFSHLTKGWFSIRWKWKRKFKKQLNVKANVDYYFTEFHFFDAHDEEIKL